jgi:F0F1-type ATP synthase assembly protein I
MALQIGFAVSATTVGCVLGGRWLDQRFQTAPTFVLLGMGLGLFLSLYLVWEIVKPLQKKYRKSGKR